MFAAAPVAASSAAASPPVRITIVLSCDKNVDADATITLQTDVGGSDLVTIGNDDLNCGPNSLSGRSRARVVADVAAGAVVVSTFNATTGGSTLGCASDARALPAVFVCSPAGNSTAQLTVK
jgi:hypothetical protein